MEKQSKLLVRGDQTRTTNRRLFVLLEVVIDKAEHQRGLVPGERIASAHDSTGGGTSRGGHHTFPTAASPRSTSFTLLLGLGAAPFESAMLPRISVDRSFGEVQLSNDLGA